MILFFMLKINGVDIQSHEVAMGLLTKDDRKNVVILVARPERQVCYCFCDLTDNSLVRIISFMSEVSNPAPVGPPFNNFKVQTILNTLEPTGSQFYLPHPFP